MHAALLLALQAAGPPAPAPDRPRAARPCTPADGSGDVVVCGRPDQERFRLEPLPELADGSGASRAETRLFGDVKAAAEVEQGDVGGIPSNRIMLRLKLPF